MHILITGASGFIGQILAKELLSDASHHLTLTDITKPSVPSRPKYPQNATVIQADLTESSLNVVPGDLDAVILLHGIMSVGAENNFDLGYRVNVDATRNLLFTLANAHPGIRVIYASSAAVYGTPVPKLGVSERDMPSPENSYGCQKVICETLVNDLTRRGMITGFSLRFPAISVRSGPPAAAVTSFMSGIIREPLNGQECIIPIKDRSWKHWICSPKTLVYNIIVALSIRREALPPHRRAVNVPGFAVTVQDMLDALEEVGGKDKLSLVKEEERDATVKKILYSLPDDFDNSLGLSLGMKQDGSFVQVAREYIEMLEK
ncbi:nucleoside-diphosphate-sugar [Seiridium cupressi]